MADPTKRALLVGKRQLYFEFFYEVRRTQARAFCTLDPAKFDSQLHQIAKNFNDLITNNKDIPEETLTKIKTLYEQYPPLKAVAKDMGVLR